MNASIDSGVQDKNVSYMIIKNKSILGFSFISYFVAILYMFPYGVESIGIRVSDLFAFMLLVASLLVVTSFWKINKIKPSLQMLFILFFMSLEILLPVLGVFYFDDSGLITSSIRGFVNWGPVFLFFLVYKGSYEELSISIEKILWVTVLVNIVVAVSQVLIYYGVLPSSLDVKEWFSAYAMDARFDKRTSMASGLFVNTTSLAVFAFLTFVFFWSKYLVARRSKYLIRSVFAFFLLLLAVSRAPLLGALLVVLVSLPFLGFVRVITRIPLFFGLIILLFAVLTFFGYDLSVSFHRFQRLEGGLSEDYSWMYRYTIIWPAMLEEVKNYPWGTLTNPTIFLGTIDSGYFSYFLQGRWIFIVALLGMILTVLFTAFKIFMLRKYSVYSFALFGVFIYLAGGMITSNPIRDPLIVFFILFYVFANQPVAKGRV